MLQELSIACTTSCHVNGDGIGLVLRIASAPSAPLLQNLADRVKLMQELVEDFSNLPQEFQVLVTMRCAQKLQEARQGGVEKAPPAMLRGREEVPKAEPSRPARGRHAAEGLQIHTENLEIGLKLRQRRCLEVKPAQRAMWVACRLHPPQDATLMEAMPTSKIPPSPSSEMLQADRARRLLAHLHPGSVEKGPGQGLRRQT